MSGKAVEFEVEFGCRTLECEAVGRKEVGLVCHFFLPLPKAKEKKEARGKKEVRNNRVLVG